MYKLLDCDNDSRQSNDETRWETVEDCLNELRDYLANNLDEICYLPWRIVDYEEDENISYCDMETVHSIDEVQVTFSDRGSNEVNFDSDYNPAPRKARRRIANLMPGANGGYNLV